MSTVLTERIEAAGRRGGGAEAGVAERGVSTLFEVPGDGATLERAVASAWDDLAAVAAATCPVCNDRLIAEHSPDGRLVGGRCGGCGARLD